MGLNPSQREFFKQAGVPDELVDQWATKNEELSKALLDAGLEYKAVDENTNTNTVGLLLEQQATTAVAIKQLSEAYKSMGEQLTALKASDDAKIAATIAPAVTPPSIASPSTSETNIIEKNISEVDVNEQEKKMLETFLGIKLPA